ncbi:SGNH/GDSL hydrolase family protein [Vibrio sinensis]|uniref:SGNH/GDSL hydrolase family protein n=1 Tax=Vibrio sinensis TaxID=2302434 RepID=A0A3A6R0U2_9VIBR|nr:SGNH/GDSL hydrolase family protein [Vibrio sinensis]RJX69485.1 SGNH/GDSL hydrolase family protein [Vibrio sinensis]
MKLTKCTNMSSLILLIVSFGAIAIEDETNWVGTWTASAQPVWEKDFPIATGIPDTFENQTVRQISKVSIGGSLAQIELSNEYGELPLIIGKASIALTDKGMSIDSETLKALTFNGRDKITIPAGGVVLSDPVSIEIPALSEVSVSVYLPKETKVSTMHWGFWKDSIFVANNDQTTNASLIESTDLRTRFLLTEIMVNAPKETSAIVAFGDSLTAGDNVQRWTDVLASRLQDAGMNIAVQNQGISGGRLLNSRMGDNAIARFKSDVLSQDDVESVLIFMGINDIGWNGSPLAKDESPVDHNDIINAYKQLISRSKANGLKVYGITLTPFEGVVDGFYTEEKEQIRQKVNAFIRSGAFDAVIDFDKVLQDQNNPKALKSEYNVGDNIHLTDSGHAAIANSIDLFLFKK